MQNMYKKKTYPVYFLIPILVIFAVFYISPAVLGLFYSLTDASIKTSGVHFVGFENYQTLFSDSATFLTSIWNQFKFAILDALGKTMIGLLLALLLNRKFKGNSFLRALIYIPIMFGVIMCALIFNYILSYDGFLNTFLAWVGLPNLTHDWLGDFTYAMYTVIGVDIWLGVGWSMMMILAALQTVSKDLLECAEIDGAGSFRKFLSITLPSISPTLSLSILLSVISGLKAFDIIYAMTGGGPGHATEVMSTYLVKSMSSGSIGYPAAISVLQFIIITIVALSINSFTNRKEKS
ncbi:sugar ABC transporter permease [Paenibacillus sp. FSL R10-2734]|uniref:carbohydrate ABC transporter permease n=1 Tax=Paenibacillus sp. FSL R10-2734 TaxID=2954691 RepID=UPI0030DA735B